MENLGHIEVLASKKMGAGGDTCTHVTKRHLRTGDPTGVVPSRPLEKAPWSWGEARGGLWPFPVPSLNPAAAGWLQTQSGEGRGKGLRP